MGNKNTTIGCASNPNNNGRNVGQSNQNNAVHINANDSVLSNNANYMNNLSDLPSIKLNKKSDSGKPPIPNFKAKIKPILTVEAEQFVRKLTLESDEKISNVDHLIEALDNFSNIFNQFPNDYYKTIQEITEKIIQNHKHQQAMTSYQNIADKNLKSINKILPYLTDHLLSVQNMIMLLSNSAEKIEVTRQFCEANLRNTNIRELSLLSNQNQPRRIQIDQFAQNDKIRSKAKNVFY